MKKYILTNFLCLLFISCTNGGNNDSDLVAEENEAPSAPTLIAPANNLLCINNFVDFQWNVSSDPNSDAVTYQIEIAKDNSFAQITYTNPNTTNNKSVPLEKGVRYYWRVKAIDSNNLASNYSSVFQFYTEGTALSNHLPFAPTLVSPAFSSTTTANSIVLEWNASDVDASDVLTYDVYFGTSNPPTSKVASNQSIKTLNQNLSVSGTYYWSIDVKDNKGGIAKGQVWSFTKNLNIP